MKNFISKMMLTAFVSIAIGGGGSLAAQTQAAPCECLNPMQMVNNLTICIGNTTYNVEVIGCRVVPQNGQPLLPEICPGSLLQNQYTSITRVCFIGAKPNPIVATDVFNAILCKMDPCNHPGNFGAQVGPIVGDIYCWTVITPKCVFVNNLTGCIEKCGDGCCVLATRWKRQADGSCIVDVKPPGNLPAIWNCDVANTNCTETPGCETITCPTRDNCCVGP